MNNNFDWKKEKQKYLIKSRLTKGILILATFSLVISVLLGN